MRVSIKAARVNAELTQSEAAHKIGVDKSTIVAWEKGKSSPTTDKFREMCTAYGATVDDVFLPIKSTP